MSRAPWEPPLAGPADRQLVASLDRMRWTFRWKCDGLDAGGLAVSIGASSLTLGGLLRHLTLVEDSMLGERLDSLPFPAHWGELDWEADPDAEFQGAAGLSPSRLYADYDEAVGRARAWMEGALADPQALDAPSAKEFDGQVVSRRRFVCDLLEEYARHTGHADLIREAIDGRVGEDPPSDWQPGR